MNNKRRLAILGELKTNLAPNKRNQLLREYNIIMKAAQIRNNLRNK